MGHELAVIPQETVQTFPFHLMLNTCSSRSESSYFTFDALNFLLTMSISLTPFFFCHYRFSIRGSKARMGNLFMHDKCMTCNLYDELALRGVTYGHNSCIMKQEFLFLFKLYNRNFLSMTIISPVSPEFKILQEGLAQMQNGAYILKTGSNLFT
jgi:hypothetical protein